MGKLLSIAEAAFATQAQNLDRGFRAESSYSFFVGYKAASGSFLWSKFRIFK